MNALSSIWNSTGMYLLYIVLAFGFVILVIILVKKFIINKGKKKEDFDEAKMADENLSRYLEDVTDPETQKQFDEYKEKDQNE